METTHSAVRGLDPRAIERELTDMWRQMTHGQPPDQTRGVMRACVLNLIASCSPADVGSDLDALLADVTEASPCRSFVVVLEPDRDESGYQAYVSSRCQLSSRGHRQVCGEQITIRALGDATETLASAVRPLLVSDVPVFLWWGHTPDARDPVFQNLASLADRLIVDSARFADPYTGFESISRFLGEGAQPVSDLNWGRLTSWRSLVASLWDVREYAPKLRSIGKVHVNYDPPIDRADRVSSKALLALGWLASRLSWRFFPEATKLKDGLVHLVFEIAGRPLDVTLQSSGTSEGLEGPLNELIITSTDGEAEFRVHLRSDGNKLETVSRLGTDMARIERVIQYEPRSEGARLAAELAFRVRDRVYEEAAAVAARIAAALQAQ